MHIINTNNLRIFNSNKEKKHLKKHKSKNISVLSCLNYQLTYLTLGLCLLATCGVSIAQAEPVPDNTTGTNVNQNGDRFDIDGGTTSGENLFHSFKKFGLNKDQIANFMSNPNIRNILGRVTGGDASVINGLIQVTGGNSNLFLINPAGIIFGKDASLNLPASFTATTANGIQVGDFWFDALGSNNYSNLVGDVNGFAFATDEAGSIVNAGNLAVSQGERINLVGGLVINTGTLEAPEGNINITAVPEKQLVKISPEGSLLSLGLPTDAANTLSAGAELVTPQALPELLTGGDLQQATDVKVADNGTIKLTRSDTEIPSDAGTTIASGNIDVSGNSGGNVNVLGDKVGVVAGNIDASGTNGGGEILIGGDYKGQGEVPNASRTFIDSESVIAADAVASGNGGKIIAWADEVTAFYGDISATGGSNSGDGGFVEVSGKDSLIFEGDVNLTAINGSDGTLLLDPRNIRIVGEDAGNNDELVDNNPDGILNSNNAIPDNLTISIDAIANENITNVTLEATENIIFEDVLVDTGSENQKFGGALSETETEGDVPQFNNLTARVVPEPGNTGTLEIRGNLAVSGDLTLENTNGDIIIGQENQPRNIFVGINSISQGVDPNVSEFRGGNTGGDSLAQIKASQGSVELHGGITLNAGSDLTIEAQRFTATDPVTLQGNQGSGLPGRDGAGNNLGNPEITYNIGVVYYGGFDNDNDIALDPEPATIQSSPNVELQVLFDPDNDLVQQPELRRLPGELSENDSTLPTANITITLLEDESFDVGRNFPQSGVEIPIQRFFRIETDGSIGGSNGALRNNSFNRSLISPPDDDNQIAQEESEVEFVAVNPVNETQKASFCSEELNIASISGSNKVKATCGEQALAFVFTQPTDEEGNPIELTEDLFPELLTGDEFINLDKSTSFEFLQIQDKLMGFSKVSGL